MPEQMPQQEFDHDCAAESPGIDDVAARLPRAGGDASGAGTGQAGAAHLYLLSGYPSGADRPCDSCLDRSCPDPSLPSDGNAALSVLGMPRWNTKMGRPANVGCEQCGGKGRVPRDSAPYTIASGVGRKQVYRQKRPRRRNELLGSILAALARAGAPDYDTWLADSFARSVREYDFLRAVYGGKSVPEATQFAGFTRQAAHKVLKRIHVQLVDIKNKSTQGPIVDTTTQLERIEHKLDHKIAMDELRWAQLFDALHRESSPESEDFVSDED